MTKDEAKKIFRSGYLAMDKNKRWAWYIVEPYKDGYCWYANGDCSEDDHYALLQNIDPVDNWEESLTECGI